MRHMKQRVIVAGGRDFQDYELLKTSLDQQLDFNMEIEIISGHASGADALGEKYARERNLALIVMPAQWKQYGRSAGPIRNRRMLEYALELDNSRLIAFWDGKSKGTKNMITQAQKAGLDCEVIMTEA